MSSVSHARFLVPSASRIQHADQLHSLVETHFCSDLVTLSGVAVWSASLMRPALFVMTIYAEFPSLLDVLLCPPTPSSDYCFSALASHK